MNRIHRPHKEATPEADVTAGRTLDGLPMAGAALVVAAQVQAEVQAHMLYLYYKQTQHNIKQANKTKYIDTEPCYTYCMVLLFSTRGLKRLPATAGFSSLRRSRLRSGRNCWRTPTSHCRRRARPRARRRARRSLCIVSYV